MANLKSLKVPSTIVDSKAVASLPDNPSEQGLSAKELKDAFDALPKEAIKALNALIDYLSTSGSSDIGITEIEGLEADTVQAALEALKKYADASVKSVRVSGEKLILTLADGTEKTANLGYFLQPDEVKGSSTIEADVESKTTETGGVAQTEFSVSLKVKEKSIGEEHLKDKSVGEAQLADELMEKINGSFPEDEAQDLFANATISGEYLVLTRQNGTQKKVSLAAFLLTSDVEGSDTIEVEQKQTTTQVDGASTTKVSIALGVKDKSIGKEQLSDEVVDSFEVKEKSITMEHLSEELMQHIKDNSGSVSIDGIVTTESSEDGGANTVKIGLTNGTSRTFTVRNGSKGSKGDDGKNGVDGDDGVGIQSIKQTTTDTSDGGVNVITVTLTNGQTATFAVRNGSKGEKGDKGDTGEKGQTGVAGVGIDGIVTTESTVDGGSNTVKIGLTNGASRTFTVRNGSKGEKGATGENGVDGVSIQSIEQTATSTADGGTNEVTVTLDNGQTSTFSVRNGSKGSKGDTGDMGATGVRGNSVLKVTTAPSNYTTVTNGKTPIKRMALSTIETQANVDTVLVGDLILHSYYLYHVYYKDNTYAYMDTSTSIRGATGAKGDKGDTGEKGETGDPGQPDWLVNEEGSAGYIKNRPFWKEYVAPSAVYVNTTINFQRELSNISGNGLAEIISGQSYIVYWNDAPYECTAFTYGSVILGNGALVNPDLENTGEPFGIEMINSTSAYVTKSSSAVETVSIKITPPSTVIYHKLPKEYLPDDYGSGTGSSGGGGVSSWNDLTDKPFGDKEVVIAAEKTFSTTAGTNKFTDLNASMVNDGQEIIVRFDGSRYECKVKDWGEGIGLATDNYSDMMAGTSELPFCLIFKDSQTNISVASSGEHTASVYAVEIMKMPGKYLPNGLPYTEGGMVEILPETTIEGADDDGDGVNDSQFYMLPELEGGKTYIVNWNGTEYECFGQGIEEEGITSVLLGNGVSMGLSGNNEPFTIMCSSMFEEMTGGAFNSMIAFTDGATYPNPTITIYSSGGTVHKLDNKYLDLDWLPTITYGKGETLFEEATLTTKSSAIEGFEGAISLSGFSLDMSKKQVCVTIDGKDYICDVMAEAGGYIAPTGSALDAALFMIYASSLYLRNAGTYTIKITDYVTYYNKMPEGFLPSGSKTKYYFNLDDVEQSICKDSAMTDTLGSAELARAWATSEVVLVDISGTTEYKAITWRANEVTIMAEINNEIVPVKIYAQLD